MFSPLLMERITLNQYMLQEKSVCISVEKEGLLQNVALGRLYLSSQARAYRSNMLISVPEES